MSVKSWIQKIPGRLERKCRKPIRAITGKCIVACARQVVFQGKRSWLLRVPGYSRLLRVMLDVFRLLYYLPGLEVWKISNSRLNIVFAGTREGLNYFRHLIGETGDALASMGWTSLLKISGKSNQWLDGGTDLVVVEASSLFSRFLRAPVKFVVPTWIEMLLPFSEPLESIIAGTKKQSLRNVINRFRRDGYSFVYGRREEDFRTFYDQMYYPFTTQKHAELASVRSFDVMYKMWGDKGGILFIEKDGVKVAGALCFVFEDSCYGIVLGLSDVTEDLYRRGILSYIYWCTVQWGHAQGARQLNMGETRPCAAQGPYPYKIKWGAKAALSRKGSLDYYFLAKDLKPSLQDRINRQKMICKHNGSLHALFVQGSGQKVSAVEVRERFAQVETEGLRGIILASTIPPDAEIEACVQYLQTGS